ncbi:hypothetical protein FEE96_07750 [Parasedimentitalea maritima]|uniref:Uncharacterized protein n=1 Tax=Parasedimentitalea maritima TaxID=2578117 RepID=A0A5R8ZN66_9RHOB|nr:hypothetical protein [Zongyanglinia marina]KAE9630468.1 hypothetical protein GP644_08685 [Zongyanglinia marina]TLP67231.1 hypothetical protein FEE96_07750 [Zongyanglinia marina]
MKLLLIPLLCAGPLVIVPSAPVQASTVERACRQSDRSASSPSLCRCIGKVAKASLSSSEQRTVAKWFDDPHQAQVIRQSDSRSDERLWLRYKAFGERAARTCS